MKLRILLLLGVLALPLPASAALALSPWVDGVLERVDSGIATADALSVPTVCDDATKLSRLQANIDFIHERATRVLALEAESWQLSDRTVCYESDRRLLLSKLGDLLDRLQETAVLCAANRATVLQATYDFLLDAYQSFLKGGGNPSYVDARLRMTYPFESVDLWTSKSGPEPDADSRAPLCAFTTDYAPHSIGYVPAAPGSAMTDLELKSYGCDVDALAGIGAPLSDEAARFQSFLFETDDLARTVYDSVEKALSSLDEFLSFYRGISTTRSAPLLRPPAEHAVASGCLRPFVPDLSSALPEEWETLLQTYPEYFDRESSPKDSSGDPLFGPGGPGEVLPEGLLFRSVGDMFDLAPSATSLLRDFIDRRALSGFNRPLPARITAVATDSYYRALDAAGAQNALRAISANNEQAMAYIEAVNRDAYQEMQDAASPLHDAVTKLVEVTDEFLPKEYVPDLAYFLARSCVDGHCQSTLDAVVKRIFNPYCTPYVDGLYLEEDATKKCFCDPSIQGTWSDFDTYCNADFSSDQARYDALEPKLYPACLEEDYEEFPRQQRSSSLGVS